MKIIRRWIAARDASALLKKLGGNRDQYKCSHPFLRQAKWKKDGTPFVLSACDICGMRDYGHVHADPDNWPQDSGMQEVYP
jgi:hypothetical protein